MGKLAWARAWARRHAPQPHQAPILSVWKHPSALISSSVTFTRLNFFSESYSTCDSFPQDIYVPLWKQEQYNLLSTYTYYFHIDRLCVFEPLRPHTLCVFKPLRPHSVCVFKHFLKTLYSGEKVRFHDFESTFLTNTQWRKCEYIARILNFWIHNRKDIVSWVPLNIIISMMTITQVLKEKYFRISKVLATSV